MKPPRALVLEKGADPSAVLPIANGNNALVLSIAGNPDAVLKWYRHDLTPGKHRRLADALAAGSTPLAAARHPGVCWPTRAVKDAHGRLAGCLMRRATPESVELTWLATEEGRGAKRLPHAPAVRVEAVRDVAAIVQSLHEDHWIVGDLQRGNVMVSLRAGRPRSVELVDSDSFWRSDVARDGLGGRTQHADGYAAPELLRDGRPPTPASDRWALAVLIFRVLNEAHHPLARADVEGMTLDAAVRAGAPSPDAFASLPDPLGKLFWRAFVAGYDEGDRRPTAEEWCVGLSALR